MEEKDLIIPEENVIELDDDLFALEEGEELPPEGAEEDEVPEDVPAGEVSQTEEKTVPLAALQQERKKVRDLKEANRKMESVISRLYQSTGAGSPEELLGRMDNIELAQYMNAHGVDEGTAKLIMDTMRENRDLKRQSDRRNFDTEISELSGNPMYDDILDVRDEVEEYALQKGLTPREAYNALYGEARAAKMSEAAKKAAIEQQKIKDSKKIRGLSQRGNGTSVDGNTYNLSASELAVCRATGMTPKEYAAYKKKE